MASLEGWNSTIELHPQRLGQSRSGVATPEPPNGRRRRVVGADPRRRERCADAGAGRRALSSRGFVTPVSYIGLVIDRMGTGPSTVSVTPISPGVTRPWILLFAVVATVREVVDVVSGAERWQPWLYAVFAGPILIVALARSVRWRSHKIHVHEYGVTVERGLGRRGRTSVAWADIGVVEVQRGLRDRLSGRGQVVLETAAGTWTLGLVRHPLALARVIESAQHDAGAGRNARDEAEAWPVSRAPSGRRHSRFEPVR